MDQDMSSVDPFQPNGQFCPKADPVKINVINVDKVINEWTPCYGHVNHLLSGAELRKNKTGTHTDRQQVHRSGPAGDNLSLRQYYTLKIDQSYNVREGVKCPEY